jgi:inorganic triphosphatase YgiF
MAEAELKFQIPDISLPGVRAALQRARLQRVHLHALYFDTPDHRLASAGLALRLRREGPRWVQAIKGQDGQAWMRLEHEAVLPRLRGADPVPAIDLSRHDGTAEGAALREALDGHERDLALEFETRVVRLHRIVRHGSARIDVALDMGTLSAGAAHARVQEIEFEHIAGPVSGWIGLAMAWARRHRLWLDARSKAERGRLLARGKAASPATKASRPALAAGDVAPDAALRACVASVLAQLLPNASVVAAGVAEPEHVHQLRVALRRLASVLREFGHWSPATSADWPPQVRRLFTALASTRDRDALAASIGPQLQAAGAPWWELAPPARADAAPSPADAARDAATTQLLLELIGFASCAASAEAHADGASALASARAGLARLHRRLRDAGKDFARLTPEDQHRARKRLKRLRYCAECLSQGFPKRGWSAYAQRLTAAQEALGRWQDMVVAEKAARAAVEREPRAWFAIGWLVARREACIAEAAAALRALGRTPRFLR